MTRTRFFCVVLAAALSTGMALAKPNFSGDWKMDPAKSDFGPMPPPETLTMKIKHEEPAVEVKSHQVSVQGEMEGDSKYTTDGKECVNTIRSTEVKSTVTWEGEVLRMVSKLNFQGNDVTLDDKWTLSEDGKTLTIDRNISSAQGEFPMKTVLVKQ
ncbi:MAG: hypothetical protein FJW20_06085 [Acidimicrobiia bacterium]|nr:hypothetical protein [Acidimicrobiia bacterium]